MKRKKPTRQWKKLAVTILPSSKERTLLNTRVPLGRTEYLVLFLSGPSSMKYHSVMTACRYRQSKDAASYFLAVTSRGKTWIIISHDYRIPRIRRWYPPFSDHPPLQPRGNMVMTWNLASMLLKWWKRGSPGRFLDFLPCGEIWGKNHHSIT